MQRGSVRPHASARSVLSRMSEQAMDEKDFKRHLKELAHGHHHPEEHDWPETGAVRTVAAEAKTSKAKTGARKRTGRKK